MSERPLREKTSADKVAAAIVTVSLAVAAAIVFLAIGVALAAHFLNRAGLLG